MRITEAPAFLRHFTAKSTGCSRPPSLGRPRREGIGGMRIIEAPAPLRHFTATFDWL